MAKDTRQNADTTQEKDAEKRREDGSGNDSEIKPAHGTPEGGPSPTLPPNPVAEPGNPGGSPA